jgi:Cu(I)-responsive transcriptional regulator
MNIGDAARLSGVSAKMIRHYESIGLLPAAARSDTGYRHYGESEVNSLRFIRAARDLGFGLGQIGDLLSLWQRRDRESREVKALALEHVRLLEAKAGELERMIAALHELIAHCHGDHRPDCPILEGLQARSGNEGVAAPAAPGAGARRRRAFGP